MMIVDVVLVTGPQDFPFGTLGGQWRFVVASTDAGGVEQTIDSDTPQAQFQLSPGAYTCTEQRLSDKKEPLGPSDSQSFEITAPATVSIDVVKGANITISAG